MGTNTQTRPVAGTKADPKPAGAGLRVSVLTGGFDRPYAFGLTTALAGAGVQVEVAGNAEVDSPEMHSTAGIEFLDLYWDPRQKASTAGKVGRILKFYGRLTKYLLGAKSQVVHVLWNHKIQILDRTLLMLFYKLTGKRVVFTAHNVNAARRDGHDSALNRFTLKIQYRLSDHIFVHTEGMKTELLNEYGVRNEAVTIIPFGINNSVPDTELTRAQAKKKLGIEPGTRTILFFGAIRPYKGLEHLVSAFHEIAGDRRYRLLIAGERKKGSEEYWDAIKASIEAHESRDQVIQCIQFVPDEETELHFKAADVLVLPYTEVFQSGVLFLAYTFGLPVIAADVGSFSDDIREGETGFLFHSREKGSLARTIERYFASELFANLDERREEIREFVQTHHSWTNVATMTCRVYSSLVR